MIDWREMERTFRNAGFQAGFREGRDGTPSTGFGGMMERLEVAWQDGFEEGLAEGKNRTKENGHG
jgi:hypothetical protein